MILPESTSVGYARNLLFVAHQLLCINGSIATDALQLLLEQQNWREQSAADLELLLRQATRWFGVSSTGWAALDSDLPVAADLYINGLYGAAPSGRIYESRGGQVWHTEKFCSLLWDGKKKAQQEGKRLLPIDAVQTSSRRPCAGCAAAHAPANQALHR